jgi:hypothetical protein
MEQPGLSKYQTTVVQILCSALFAGLIFVSNESWGQTPQVIQTTSMSCTEAKGKIGEAVTAGEDACLNDKKCLQEALNCESASYSSSTASLNGASVGESCDSLVNTACLDQNVGASQSAREEKRDAGSTRKEATAAKEKATEEFQKAQTDATQKQNDAAKQMVDLRKQYRDERQKITEEEEKAMSEAQKSKLEGVKQAQQAYDEIDTAYITMRDELRKLADTVSNGDLTWKVQCRATALTKSKEVQAEMDKRMAAEDAAVNQINNQATGLFGLRYRRITKKRKRIADEYNETLVRCLKGELNPGAEMKIKLDQARLEYASKEKLAQDKAAQLENRRKNLQAQLEALQKSVDEQLQKTATRLKQQLANAEEDFNQNMQLLQQQQAAAQQTAQQSQAANLKKLEQADRDLQAASRDQTLASNRLLCADRNGGRSTSASTSSSVNMTNVRAARQKLGSARGYCADINRLCGANSTQSANDQESTESMSQTCAAVTNMMNASTQAQKDARTNRSSSGGSLAQ